MFNLSVLTKFDAIEFVLDGQHCTVDITNIFVH